MEPSEMKKAVEALSYEFLRTHSNYEELNAALDQMLLGYVKMISDDKETCTDEHCEHCPNCA